jgi:hypothetical protein
MAIHIRRREFVVTLGGATACWPLARAQPVKTAIRIEFLSSIFLFGGERQGASSLPSGWIAAARSM